jgi:excisionase family DNA binding protein
MLLTVPEVAAEIRLGITTTNRLIREGRLKSVKIDGSRRIRRADLDKYVAAL